MFLRRNSEILLLRRFNTGYEDGSYSMIAGHLDGGEPLTEGMSREAFEEVGITIDPLSLNLVHVMHVKSELPESNADERVNFYFTAENYEGDIYNKEPDKCDEVKWFDINNLPANIIPHVNAAIVEIRKNSFFSKYGW